MKHFPLILGFLLALCAAAPAQVTPNGSKSDETLLKIRQIDILNQLLPLAIRKEQYDPILKALEKARQKEKQIRAMEDADLAKIDPELTDAVNQGLEKGAFPPHDMQVNVAKLLNAMGIRRQVAVGEMVDDFITGTSTVFDAGQKKVMANSLDAAALDPSIKKDQMTEDQKIKFFVKKVFMDQTAYEMLLKLQKIAS